MREEKAMSKELRIICLALLAVTIKVTTFFIGLAILLYVGSMRF